MLELNKFVEMLDKLPDNQKEMLLKGIAGRVSVINKNMPGFEYLTKLQNIINNDGIGSSVYDDKPYLVTTRNQRYVEKVLPENAESAFVILSAADTLFELVSRDVKRIVAVDKNDLQYLIFKLRYATLMTLSAKDFENFLINVNNRKFMSLDVFNEVKEAFKDDIEAINVWENLLKINPQEDLVNHLFKGVGGDVAKTVYALPFLKRKASYYELRDKLEKAEIVIKLEDALTYLINNPTEKFDYIDITNILLFIYQYDCSNRVEDFLEKLKSLRTIYENNLNVGGTFVLDYLFGIHIADLGSDVAVANIMEYIREIYRLTYQQLSENFELESFNVEKLIKGFGDKTDTVVLAKKNN